MYIIYIYIYILYVPSGRHVMKCDSQKYEHIHGMSHTS